MFPQVRGRGYDAAMRWLIVAVMVSGCGSDRMLEISSSTPGASSISGGSLWVAPPNSHQFPEPLTLKLRIYELCRHHDGGQCELDIRSGTMSVVAGSPCGLTIPTTCSDTRCFAEVQVTGPGNCVLQVRAETTDGYDAQTCWYRAIYEAADPFDPAVFEMYSAKTNREVADCESAL
jgi:hypothetical protein